MRAAWNALGAPRTGQVDPPAKQPTWEEYVASWPAWRELDGCLGPCPRAYICGRAGMCADTHPRRLVWALARLSTQARLRAPGPGTENFLSRELSYDS